MSTPGHVPDGTDLLTQELREEVAHLVRHPIEELKRLEHVAADGDSPTTPMLTVIGIGLARALRRRAGADAAVDLARNARGIPVGRRRSSRRSTRRCAA